MSSINTKVATLLKLYKDNPVLAMEQLFKVTPDQQQADLILSAVHEGSRIAVKSAQGAGKTSTLVWLTLYFLLTLDDCRILVTSPSANQLHRVFHAETLKWHAKMPKVFRDFFEITTKRINIKNRPYQKADLVTASAENQENLAGGHSENYVILADEASAIEEPVFDVLQGTLGTGSGGRFVMTANPVRNSGRFYEIFSKAPKIWERQTFSAFESAQINPAWIEEMEDFYGKDSDRYKVSVLAEFPRASEEQFVPTEFVEQAMTKEMPPSAYRGYPKVMGCDVARFGSDETVFVLRQGPKVLDVKRYHGIDTTEVAAYVVDFFNMHRPEAIYVDAIGIGAGVFDQCKQYGLPVVEVVVSQKSSNPKEYFNLRSQLWGEMRWWLQNGADIPDDPELKSQLCDMTYNYNGRMQMQLANKKDLKKQGLKSPDIPDALSLTFAPNTQTYSPAHRQKRKVTQSNYLWA